MVEFFQRLSNEVREVWLRLETGQRLSIMFFAALCVSIIVVLVFWAARPSFVPFGSGLSNEELVQAGDALGGAGIAHEVRGDTVWVDSSKRSQARKAMADTGIVGEGAGGATDLNALPIGTTKDQLELLKLKDQEEQLQRTIKETFGARSVDVKISIPEQSFFAVDRDLDRPRASVTISTPPGRLLSNSELSSIRDMVSPVHTRLNREDIGVVYNGKTVFEVASALQPETSINNYQLAYTRRVEDEYERGISEMLMPIFPDHRVTVRADVDFDKVTEEELKFPETFEPVIFKKIEDKTDLKEIDKPSAEGVAGATSGIPGAGSLVRVSETTDKSKVTTEESTAPYTLFQRKRSPSIESIHVSVLLGGTYVPPPADSLEGTEPTYVAPEQADIDTVTRLVAAATGLSSDDNKIYVAHMRFAPPGVYRAPLAGVPTARDWSWLTPAIKPAVVGLLAIAAFFFLRQSLASLSAAVAAAPEVALPEVEITDDEMRRRRVNEELGRLSREKPDTLSQVLRAWLSEE